MPRAAPSNGPKRGKAPKGRKLAEQFPQGTVLKDTQKNEWKLDQIIGQGGFGLIYNASSDTKVTDKTASFVVKIEPISNGPLYCEMQFYIRAAQLSQIKSFVYANKLRYLSVPIYLGSGMHTLNSQTYRFLVIPRFGTDLQKLLISSGGTFPESTVFAVGLRMIDALQYIHEKEYVHADVKASNIMLGYHAGKEISNEVYLCDYGLAYRYSVNGDHKEYKEDPRKAHDGTIEFTSRDAHKGVFPARRGDLEILGYCMLQWLYGKLPWEDKLTDQNYVAAQKSHYMDNVRSLIGDCLHGGKSTSSDTLLKYLELVRQLDYDEEPSYDRIKTLFKSGLSKCGQKDEWKIEFSAKPKTQKRKSRDLSTPVVSPKQSRVASPKKTGISPKKKPKASPSISARAKGKKSPSVAKARGKTSPAKKTSPKSSGIHRKTPAKSKSPKATQGSKQTRQIPPPSKPEAKSKCTAHTFTQIPPPSKTLPKVSQLPPPFKSKTSSKTSTFTLPPPSKAIADPRTRPTMPSSNSSPRQIPLKSKTIQIPPPSKPFPRH